MPKYRQELPPYVVDQPMPRSCASPACQALPPNLSGRVNMAPANTARTTALNAASNETWPLPNTARNFLNVICSPNVILSLPHVILSEVEGSRAGGWEFTPRPVVVVRGFQTRLRPLPGDNRHRGISHPLGL